MAALVAAAVMKAGALLDSGAASAAAYVPGQVIVGYSRGAIPSVTADMERRMGVRASTGTGAAGPGAKVLRLPRGESVPAAIAALRHQPGVAYAAPNFIAHSAGAWYPDDPGSTHRSDGWESMQWNFLTGTGVNAPEAWSNLLADHRPGGRGVVVAVLDTGVAYRNWHQFRRSPDLGGTRFVDP